MVSVEEARRRIILSSPHIVTPTSAALQNFSTDMVAPLKGCKIYFNPIQEGTGEPSPTNVRPISGWTGINVYRTGINIWDEEWEHGIYNTTNGTKNDVASVQTRLRAKNLIPCAPNTQYYCYYTTDSKVDRIMFYKKDGTFITGSAFAVVYRNPFTTPSDAYFMTFYTSSAIDNYGSNISFNCPSSDTNYHMHIGTTIPVNWTTEAGTAYGGYVDLINGELVVNIGKVQITSSLDFIDRSSTSTYSGTYEFRLNAANNPIPPKGNTFFISNMLGNVFDRLESENYADSYYINPSNNRLHFYMNSEINTLEKFRTFLNNNTLELCYKIVPVTYQLTPMQLKTLLGTNNIWSTANGQVEIQYYRRR